MNDSMVLSDSKLYADRTSVLPVDLCCNCMREVFCLFSFSNVHLFIMMSLHTYIIFHMYKLVWDSITYV